MGSEPRTPLSFMPPARSPRPRPAVSARAHCSPYAERCRRTNNTGQSGQRHSRLGDAHTLDTTPPFSTPVSTAPAPGAITFVDSTGFTINSAPGGGFAGLELGITTTGTATLQAAGTIDQNGEVGFINAQNLVVRTLSDSGANIFLDTAANTVPGNVTLTALNAAGTALARRVYRLLQRGRVHDRIDRRIGDRRCHDR